MYIFGIVEIFIIILVGIF